MEMVRFWIRQFITLSSGAELPETVGVAGVYSEVRRDEDATGTELAESQCHAAATAKEGYQSHLSTSLSLGVCFRASGLDAMSVAQGSPRIMCRHQEILCDSRVIHRPG